MADEKIVTSIVANSDFSNLIADVQRVTGSLFKLQQEFAGANRALAGQIDATNAMFKETMLKTGQFSSHFVSLTSDVEKFGRNLDSGRLKLKDYFRVYQEHTRTSGGLIRDLAKQQVQLQNAVLQPLGRNAQGLMQYNVHIPRGLDLTKNKTSLLKQELQIMNKVIQDGGVQLINWGKNTQWAGRQLTVGLTLPLVAFGKAAADAFKVADQELTRLTKVYGDIAGTSAQELDKVRQNVSATAKELSAAMGVNFAETISLAADIAATGKTGNELLSSVSETTRLAVLGEVDRQEAMKATLAIQSAFKQNTDELAQSINFLNAVENQTSTTLNDLVEAIPKAGPVIKGLGGSVQDLALYLTAMREGGINASEGANALKSALASLINPTDVAVKKFKGLGIDLLGIVNKNAGDVTATLFALQSALDRLDPLQKQQAIEQLFGKFQFSRLNALFENLGRQGSQTLQVLDLMKASAGELEAVAGRELAAVTESASGRYRRAIESLKADLAGVGDEFLDIATKLINVLNKVIEFGQKLPDPIKKIMAFGGAFTAIIGPVIMLTGVLANFFGYIIKGLGHFKALFKGAEGFKLLTPEIIAAKAAGAQLSDEFYSDALAADTMRMAIRKLAEDLALLQKNAISAKSAAAGLGQTITTAAGTPITTFGAPRVTDPTHPLVGPRSRAAAHLNPRNPNDPATIFGLTLQPIPVNRRIGRNPQILMQDRLEDIEGLTTIGGVSTGVVAGEHARYQALMATLGLQSKREIEELKKTIRMGGSVSAEFMATFDDILPITQDLTANAARQSAAIVAELRAGKISVEQARAAIISVNAQLERDLGISITSYGAQRGRTIDLTKAPLIDQPVVDVAGKPNTRGMFRKGIFAKVMGALGRATGTKTLGGPYSIETTRPIQRNMGGGVFYNNGDQVPGPAINADIVPAMLTPGEFVIRRDVAQQDPDGMRALNEGRAMIVPFGANMGGKVPGYINGGGVMAFLRTMRGSQRPMVGRSLIDTLWPGRLTPRATQSYYEPKGNTGAFGGSFARRSGETVSTSYINKQMEGIGVNPRDLLASINARGVGSRLSTDVFLDGLVSAGLITKSQKRSLSKKVFDEYARQILGMNLINDRNNPIWPVSNRILARELSGNPEALAFWRQYSSMPGSFAHPTRRSSTAFLNEITLGGRTVRFSNLEGSGSTRFYHSKESSNPLVAQVEDLISSGGSFVSRNRGGIIPGYQNGGGVSRATLLARLGARFKYTGKHYDGPQALQTYTINAMDINGGKKYFGNIPGLSDKGKGALYDATLKYFNTTSIKGDKIDGKRLFNSNAFLPAMPIISKFALSANRNWMSPDDIAILESMAGRTRGLRDAYNLSAQTLHPIHKQVFGANRGGMVPGYAGGGPVQYGYARGVQRRLLGGGILRMLAAMGVMQGGMALGQRVGGGTGTAISTASSILPFMMMPGVGMGGPSVGQRLGFSEAAGIKPMSQSVFSQSTPVLGRFATSLGNAATSGNVLQRTVSKLLIGITRFTGVVGLAVGAAYGLYKIWNNYNKTQEMSAAQFGMTADAAEKAGLKYVDYNQKVKDAVDAQKLLVHQNRITYQNMASAGTPFKMTISEYKALKKEVKETMSSQIDMLNAIENKDVPRVATQLKTQFIAMGLSAEDASKRVYTLLQMSDKSFMTVSAMSSKPFTDIIDAQTAAVSALKAFNYAKEFENSRDQAAALNTALMAIDGGIKEIYDKAERAAAKKKEDFDATKAQYNAEKTQLEAINSRVQNQRSIGSDVLRNLEKQNPLIRQFANEQDSVVSLWQKMRIAARGYTGDLDELNRKQTQRLYDAQIAIGQAVEKSNKEGLLKSQYNEYQRLYKLQKDLESAAKGQSVREQINARDAIRAIDRKIKKINEEAEARKKALREEAQAEDIALRIQKQRLEYEKMVSAGDFTGAAEARLELQRLLNEQQTVLAEQQIEEKRQRDLAPLEREKEKLQRNQEKLADKAALAAESLDAVNKKLEAQKKRIDEVNNALTSLMIAKATGEGLKGAAARFIKALEDAGVAVNKYQYVGGAQGVAPMDPVALADKYLKDGKFEINEILAEKDIRITANGNIIVDGKKLNVPDGSAKNPFAGGRAADAPPMNRFDKTGIDLTQWNGAPGPFSARQQVKAFAKQEGYKEGDYFTLTTGNKADGTLEVHKFRVREDGEITRVSVEKADGMFDGGPIAGPGTSTSDSIPIMASDGEFMMSAKSVKNAGGPAVMSAIHEYFKGAPKMLNGGLVSSGKNVASNLLNAVGLILNTQNPLLQKLFGNDMINSYSNILSGKGGKGDYANLGASVLPVGPGAKLFHGTHKLLKAGDIISPSGRTLYTASTGKHIYAGTDAGTAAFWGKKAAEKVGQKIGNRFRSYVYEIEPLGKTITDQMTPDAMMIEGAAKIVKMVKKARSKSSMGFAGGGYISQSYSPPMNIPSFKTGIPFLYDDTIAQLHAREAVLPENMNPWNPAATNPIGGTTINMPLTVNAAPGMDEDYLINKAAIKVQKAMETALTKVGTERNISRRYQ